MKRQPTMNRDSGTRPWRPSIAMAAMGAIAFGWLTVVTAHDVANGTLAAAIRSSGHPCDRVIEKERSGESASVWRVRCNSGRFLVTMKGDVASEVVALD